MLILRSLQLLLQENVLRMSEEIKTRKQVNDIQAMCLGIHTVPEDSFLGNVLTITTAAMIEGRLFRNRSQYIFIAERDVTDIICNCITKEWLVEIPEMTGPEGQIVPAWTGWISEMYAVAPARERLSEPDQDATGSYSRKWVNSALPPWLRNRLAKGTTKE